MTIIELAGGGLDHFVRFAVLLLEAAGTLTILGGALLAVARFAARRGDQPPGRQDVDSPYGTLRAELGRSILLGLEFMVAGDILKSLVISPTLDDLLVLGGLIMVRTFLSVSLSVEIAGHWPWQETRLRQLRTTDLADTRKVTGSPCPSHRTDFAPTATDAAAETSQSGAARTKSSHASVQEEGQNQ